MLSPSDQDSKDSAAGPPSAAERDPARLAALIPAYQAERWVEAVARGAAEQLPRVLVVDDGSTDGTADAARRGGAEVLSLPENRGKGAALAAGFAHLFADDHPAVLTLDADGQHLPSEIPKLIPAWQQGADLVFGSRSHLFAEMSGLRRVSNGLSSRIISFVSGVSLDDVQTGFRIYTRHLLEATGFPEQRFDAESAVVVRAGRRGFRLASVPVQLGGADGRGSSHYRALVDGLRIAWAVTRARLERMP
ncbi:MAG: glycosyltransferase family 2 protein [Acidobacteriota bacterium]|nr:glycosyltransferase family 2 protein [Acidobacteriota bacterium]